MKHTQAALRSMVAAAALAGVVQACLDFTPITSFGGPSGDGGVDASADAMAGQANKCLTCAAGGYDAGGCPSEYKACFASATCQAAVLCATNQCLTSLSNVGQCLTACETDAGVSDPSSRGNAPFSALLSCMSTHCETACIP